MVYGLNGRPICISPDDNIVKMDEEICRKHVSFLRWVLKNKLSQLNAVLLELYSAMLPCNHLSKNYLVLCIGANSIILMWNGSTDTRILARLGFNNTMLNMTAHDDNNRLILSYCLGLKKKKKNGRYPLLTETHQLICNTNHDSLIAHNPVHDVKLTDCNFRYLLAVTCTTNIVKLL